MPLGYWIWLGLLMLAVSAANTLDDRSPKWLTMVAGWAGAGCLIIAGSIVVLRIP